MKEIKCTLSTIDKAIKELDKYQREVVKKHHEAVERVAELGKETAQIEFSSAVYDGENDVSVSTEWSDMNTCYVTAKGDAVAFIEFGTGVTYNAPAPYDPEIPVAGLVGRGEYGHHLGRLDSWYYDGEPGSNGTVIREGKHAGRIETQGNPANLCLYYAVKEMKKQRDDIVREVFR